MNDLLERIRMSKVHVYSGDGTLVDSFQVFRKTFNQLGGEYGLVLSDADLKSMVSQGDLSCMINIFERYVMAIGQQLHRSQEEEAERWLQIYGSCSTLPTPYKHATDMIVLSRRLGKKVGIVTDATKTEIERDLEALGLVSWDFVVSRGDVDNPKPDPEGMDLLLEKMRFTFHPDIVYIGDCVTDVQFAKNAGALSVFLQTKRDAPGIGDLSFRNIGHFYSVFDRYLHNVIQ